MILFFDVDRDAEGHPKLVVPGPDPMTPKQAFARRCYLNGVSDGAVVDRLWAVEVERRKKATADAKAAARRPRPRKPPTKKGRK